MVTSERSAVMKSGRFRRFLLDTKAENVVPTAAIQAGRMIAQFVQNLVHFKRGENRFDQNGSANGALRNSQLVLRKNEHVIPETRFEMTLHLWKIEIWPGAARDLVLRVMEKEQAEIEEGAGDGLAVYEEMLFVQMPTTRTHQQRGDLVVGVDRSFPSGLVERMGSRYGVTQIVLGPQYCSFRVGEFPNPQSRP